MKASKVAQMIKLFNEGVELETILVIMITLESNKQRLAKAIVSFFNLIGEAR